MAPQSKPIVHNIAAATINGKHSWLLEYYREAKNGNIIVGHELLSCLDMCIRDLCNPQFRYDTSDADFRIEFIERFCKHTKSPFNGKPFILTLWQKAFVETLYSFKMADTGFRRFKKAILLIARKNGKSTLCAALAMAELFCGNRGAGICCSSNDDRQSGIIFDEINKMREKFDKKNKRSKKNQKGIFCFKADSVVFKISDKTQNKEGFNIDFGILDESHEMKTNIIAKSIEQSQSTKDEPLFINITTEGFTNDGYLDAELRYARRVLEGEKEDYSILPWLYTQDSEVEIYRDSSSWVKSNPSYGTIKKHKYFVDIINKAQDDKAERIMMLAKDFNIKQNNAAAWLTEAEIINPETFDLDSFRGCLALGAVDLSETTDLTSAKVMIFKPGDNKRYVFQRYFIPKTKVDAGSREDHKNYLEWARQDMIDITDGNENDFSLVTQWFLKLYKEYGLRIYKIGYDRHMATYWVKEMEEFGFDLERVNMDKHTLSPAMKLAEADLRTKKINYNSNPIDIWNLENTSIVVDGLGLQMPVKVNDQRNRRIDGALTLIIVYVMYIRYRSDIYSMAA